ncbi:hypothetical protein [Streptomyces sp. NBRC 110035]|uniref:hypothetical protein n=1 Tax=Streptomyces sp. NBRC 110035 TaxID=1547867 RepID=UPI0005A681F5|nr:hypothetical protein [Streptomyces sp. NBRC 110035]
MDTAVRSWLLAELGTATDLVDLEARYTRLGSARAVALEILRERLAALRAQPSTVNVSGVVAVGFAENIKAYERQIAALENGEPPAPDDPTDGSTGSGLGMLRLVERPRR